MAKKQVEVEATKERKERLHILSNASKRNRKIELGEGEILAFKVGQSFNLVCCDCGLTHRIKTGIIKKEDRITLKITRDNRRTALYRRKTKAVNYTCALSKASDKKDRDVK